MWHGLLALLLASSQRGLKDRKQRARFNMDWVREDNLVLLQRGERTTNSSAEGIIDSRWLGLGLANPNPNQLALSLTPTRHHS